MNIAGVLTGLSIFLGVAHGNGFHYAGSSPDKFSSSNGRLLVCYYQPTGYFPASAVPASICTHLIYAFGEIVSVGDEPTIKPPSTSQEDAWNTLTSLRRQNPGLSVMLSLQQDFNLAVGPDTGRMKTFANNVVAYLRKYQFDGVDIDWEPYPKSSQKADFAAFFKIMRRAMEQEVLAGGQNRLQLSAALPNSKTWADRSFDLPTIGSNIDFATAMTYDFHLFVRNVDNQTGYNSPLYTPPGDNPFFSASAMAKYYLQNGVPAGKLLLGISTYGRSWELKSPSSHGFHAPAVGKGAPGPVRHITGVYGYPDSCTALKQGAQAVRDTKLGALYLYKGTTWVAYDDMGTLAQKAAWATQTGLGGVGVWSMTHDDISNMCGNGTFPLLNTLRTAMQSGSPQAGLLYQLKNLMELDFPGW